jgi:hypothetical protein
MSKQFFYVQLKFTPKTGIHTVPITHQREAVVEVPKYLVQRKQIRSDKRESRAGGNRSRSCAKGGSRRIPDRCGTDSGAVRRRLANLA